MNKVFQIISLCATLSFGAQALELQLEPGNLRSMLPRLESTTDASLVLKGTASDADLALLKRISQSVKSLDMTALDIETLPPFVLTGTRIESVQFPASLVTIGEGAFASSALRKVSLPETVRRIDAQAFASCPYLSSASLGRAVTFGAAIFKDCVRLVNVEYGVDPISIATSMYEGCSSYNKPIPESVCRIGASAYRGSALETVDLSNITTVGDFAFADIPSLVEVTLPSSADIEIGAGAFFNDSGLSQLPQWAGAIPAGVYAHTSGVTAKSIDVPEISDGAFANNKSIESVSLGSSVKKIGSHAFRNIRTLKSVNVENLGNSIPDVQTDSFSGLENDEGKYEVNLYVKDGTQTDWLAHPVWGLFTVATGTTGIVGDVGEKLVLNLSREGGVIAISSNVPVKSFEVFDVAGTLLNQGAPGECECSVTVPEEIDVLIVRVAAGDRVVVKKLL